MTRYKVRKLKSRREKMRGLLGTDKPYPVFFRTRWGIHTWGMKFPIDVLILNAENKVVKMGINLAPNRIFWWLPKYDRVLELPAGEIEKKKLKIGDQIAVK